MKNHQHVRNVTILVKNVMIFHLIHVPNVIHKNLISIEFIILLKVNVLVNKDFLIKMVKVCAKFAILSAKHV